MTTYNHDHIKTWHHILITPQHHTPMKLSHNTSITHIMCLLYHSQLLTSSCLLSIAQYPHHTLHRHTLTSCVYYIITSNIHYIVHLLHHCTLCRSHQNIIIPYIYNRTHPITSSHHILYPSHHISITPLHHTPTTSSGHAFITRHLYRTTYQWTILFITSYTTSPLYHSVHHV